MIFISKTASGILVQRDETEIEVDHFAISSTLGPIIVALVDCSRACGQARHEGYEAGLERGREQFRIEYETSLRIAARQAEDLVDALAVSVLASAA